MCLADFKWGIFDVGISSYGGFPVPYYRYSLILRATSRKWRIRNYRGRATFTDDVMIAASISDWNDRGEVSINAGLAVNATIGRHWVFALNILDIHYSFRNYTQ